MNKKITTIEDLAVMIGKESQANEKRFGRLEGRFDALEERFDKLEGRFTTLEGKIEGMATKQDLFQMEKRIMSAVGDIKTDIKDHDKRILVLEKIVKP